MRRGTLADLVDIEVGFPFKSAAFSRDSRHPALLRGDNIGQGFLRWDNAARWDPGQAVPERYHLADGDLVLAMDRPWIESGLKYARVTGADLPAFLVQRVARLRAKPEADQGYVACLLGAAAFTEYVKSVQTGTAVPHISARQILDYPVIPHPLPAQRAIAEVLGALDDKIAANTRLASTADDLAVNLFRQAVAESDLGPPTFDDLAEVGGGGTPSTKVAEYWDGEIPWASPTDITRLGGHPYLFQTARGITPAGLANCSSRLYPAGSILMTSRATIGAFALAQVPTAVNQGFIVVVPPDETLRFWLFHEMRDRVDEFLTHANGATFLELSRGAFRRLRVRRASRAVMDAFSARARDLHAAAAAALKEGAVLAATRDALLPALMSGELRVRDAERLVEDAL